MDFFENENTEYEKALASYLKAWQTQNNNRYRGKNKSQICQDDMESHIRLFKSEWSKRAVIRENQLRAKMEADALEERRCELVAEENKRMDLPMDWNNIFDDDIRTENVTASCSSDALILSMCNLGKVDIEYMASITGISYKDIINDLKGSIFQNPLTWNECFFKGWETKDQYLSGNLKDKWNEAVEANNKYKGYFEDNIKAIEEVMPKSVASKDIYVSLGSPWVPTDIIDEFIVYLLGKNCIVGYPEDVKVKYDKTTGLWRVPNKSNIVASLSANNLYGTKKIKPINIIEKTLNGQSIEIYDKKTIVGFDERHVTLNKEETQNALEKQKLINHVFKDWIWRDEGRKKRLEDIFESKYSSLRTRKYDGSFLTFPGMNENISLYPYQKNAVARILFSKNTLLAHDVGAGKTYVMIAAGMELKRMGLSQKNLYVVPNGLVEQWYQIFKDLYKNANILKVEPNNFTPKNRNKILSDIKNNHYDGIIMAYSCFTLIPLSWRYQVKRLEDERRKIINSGTKVFDNPNYYNNRLKNIENQLSKIKDAQKEGGEYLYFDDLKISRLFVDEAHNFKNIPITTKIQNVYGINHGYSSKCKDMYDKVKYLQYMNNGGGVVFATATPITNSLVELYAMQKYLQEGMLKELDIDNFDNWIAMFAQSSMELEVDVDTKKFRFTRRFSKFHNLNELTTLLSMVTDFHYGKIDKDLPKFNGYKDEIIEKSPILDEFFSILSRRAERVRRNRIDLKRDNMLKITTDGRKAALDMRLILKFAPFSPQCKVVRCAENVKSIYQRTRAQRGTQLVFCDVSVPSDKFNIYDELKQRLIDLGISESEIAYIHDAEGDGEKLKLFKKVKNGDIRVLIGSTAKLGTGVNVQDRLKAIHHLDVPWRPSDLVQREGRILRQGNMNDEIEIYRYITKGSFDAYSWQILETKQRFINGLLSGAKNHNSYNDIDGSYLNYGEVKALAVENPLMKRYIDLTNNLARCSFLRVKAIEIKQEIEVEIKTLERSADISKISNSENAELKLKEKQDDLSEQINIINEYSNTINSIKEEMDSIEKQLGIGS